MSALGFPSYPIRSVSSSGRRSERAEGGPAMGEPEQQHFCGIRMGSEQPAEPIAQLVQLGPFRLGQPCTTTPLKPPR